MPLQKFLNGKNANNKVNRWSPELATNNINIFQPPKSKLTKAQSQAIWEVKRDRDCIVLTADKGVAMVIMDRQDYINKANNLLNQPIYRAIPWNPTNTIKNKLINILKGLKIKQV